MKTKLYMSRMVVFSLWILAIVIAFPGVPLVLAFVIELGWLGLTIPGGISVAVILFGTLVESGEAWKWLFERKPWTVWQRDYRDAMNWANKTFPGLRKDPWAHMEVQTSRRRT